MIILIIFAIGIVIKDLSEDGYAYYGDGWQSTPEKALAVERDDTILDEEQTLTIRQLLDTHYIDDIVEMIFVSKADTLVIASFVTNDSGKYHFSGHSEETVLENPRDFVLNGDDEQWILFPYFETDTTVYGFKYSSAPDIVVNGLQTKTKTYVFQCQGREWSIDFWWIDNFDTNQEISVQYRSD